VLGVCVLLYSLLSCSLLTPSTLWAATPGITLIGKGLIDGTALDKSGLTGISARTAFNQLRSEGDFRRPGFRSDIYRP